VKVAPSKLGVLNLKVRQRVKVKVREVKVEVQALDREATGALATLKVLESVVSYGVKL